MLLAGILYSVEAIGRKDRQEALFEEYYTMCDDFEAASELFSDEAREYAIDYDINRVQRYWEEASETRTIEKCLEKARNADFTKAELLPLENAAQTVNLLREYDAEAMLLVSDGCSYDRSALPSELTAYTLSLSQRSLDNEDKLYTARIMLYGEKYSNAKDSIRMNIEMFREVIDLRHDEYDDMAAATLKISAYIQLIGLSVIFAVSLFMFVVYRFFCVIPLEHNAKKAGVSANIRLDERGFAELVAIEKSYNQKNEKEGIDDDKQGNTKAYRPDASETDGNMGGN